MYVLLDAAVDAVRGQRSDVNGVVSSLATATSSAEYDVMMMQMTIEFDRLLGMLTIFFAISRMLVKKF